MIVTNVDNFYVADDKIINSPSRERGVSEEDEFAMRVRGCELVQEAAVLLKASQQVACAGNGRLAAGRTRVGSVVRRDERRLRHVHAQRYLRRSQELGHVRRP